jgi:hypothetical protein
MAYALLVGLTAQSSLFFSGIAVYWVRIPPLISGIMGGLGAGLLLNAIAFDLVPESDVMSQSQVAFWALAGAAIFIVLDNIIEKRFSGDGPGDAMGIVVGSVVDGIPESLILGMQIAAGDPIWCWLYGRNLNFQHPSSRCAISRFTKSRLEHYSHCRALAHGRHRMWCCGWVRVFSR